MQLVEPDPLRDARCPSQARYVAHLRHGKIITQDSRGSRFTRRVGHGFLKVQISLQREHLHLPDTARHYSPRSEAEWEGLCGAHLPRAQV